MEAFNSETFVATLAVIGVVIVVAALLSGLIERTGLPQVAVLLGIGAAFGPAGLGLINATLDSSTLRVVATLSLALVLFTDAVSLSIPEVRRHARLALLVVGPGSLLAAAALGLAAWALLGLHPALAAILGAALASTDPILLRGMLRGMRISERARLALRLESGMNDIALLPIVLIAVALLEADGAALSLDHWAELALDLLVLGPGAGVVVGLVAVALLDVVRRRVGVRRDYESLYAIGVALAAFAAAESVHGSGFLAAFAAGLTVAALDVEMCDCFLEYGETTAEMTLLFTFVLLGAAPIWSGLTILSWPVALFALLALFGRIPILYTALSRMGLTRADRLLIGWLGPRGLGSLLLVLLAVFAGIPGATDLFSIAALVVLLSVGLHGFTPLVASRKAAAPATPPPADGHGAVLAPTPAATNGVPPIVVPADEIRISPDGLRVLAQAPERITIEQLRALQASGEPVVILDVRAERSYASSDVRIPGDLRLPPDDAARLAAELRLPREAWIIPYCT